MRYEQRKKNSILIIDDDKSNIIILTHILNSDYTLYVAKNGYDGINLANTYLPDVILLDIRMPDMDGYEVLSTLKNADLTKDIPVIFITGLNKVVDEEKGLALGAADYIAKPFSVTIVKLRVKNQIRMIEQLSTIETLSATDQLTGIANRRSFDSRLTIEWAKIVREKMPISILMIDIDKFKNYNDTYGHQQGDVALRSFAKTFMSVVKRSSDFAARWGGEEFIALLPNTSANGAVEVAERLRKSVENVEIPIYQNPDGCPVTKITVSIGVNTRTIEDNYTVDDFISGADAALYTAKNSGRNKVCHFHCENERTDVHE